MRLALPIALQSLMLASVAAGDALMLGKVAQDEMTAVSLATQIQFVQNMFLMAVTGAGAILGAQYWGKGDRRTLEDIFNLMLRFCGILSVIFFLASALNMVNGVYRYQQSGRDKRKKASAMGLIVIAVFLLVVMVVSAFSIWRRG